MIGYTSDVKLGERYRDEQSGIEGIAVSVHFYQHACERIVIEYVHDGKLEELVVDAPRLASVETSERLRSARPGGPARTGEASRAVPQR